MGTSESGSVGDEWEMCDEEHCTSVAVRFTGNRAQCEHCFNRYPVAGDSTPPAQDKNDG